MSVLAELLQSAIELLPLVAVLINLLAILVLKALDRFNQVRRFSWIAAVGGGFLSWLLLFLSVIRLPHVLPWFSSGSTDTISILPVFVYDNVSWPYAFALGTLTLAVLLTAPTREVEGKPVRLSAELGFGAAGVLAVAAATPLSIVMVWSFLDGLELLILFTQSRESAARRHAVVAYAFRSLAVLILLWQMAVNEMSGVDLGMLNLAPEMSVILLLVVAVRLGVYPLVIFPAQGEPLRQGLTTLMRMVNAATALVVLGRVAGLSASPIIISGLFLVAGFAAFYSAVRWAWVKDNPSGRYFWFISTGAFAAGACLLGQVSASLAWGLAMLLPGAIFSLFPQRDRRWLWLSYLSILAVSAIPYSPLWFGTSIYDTTGLFEGLPFPHNLFAWIGLATLFIAQAFLLNGYVRQVANSRIAPHEPGMWQSLGDFSGNLLLVVVYLSLGGWMLLSGQQGTWLPSAAVVVLTAVIAFLQTTPGQRLRFTRRKPVPEDNPPIILGENDPVIIEDEGRALIPNKTPAPIPDESSVLIPNNALTFIPANAPGVISEKAPQPATVDTHIKSFFIRISRIQIETAVNWFPPFIYKCFFIAQKVFQGISRTLEGQGGVLWALLLFMLLISFVFRPPEPR